MINVIKMSDITNVPITLYGVLTGYDFGYGTNANKFNL